MFKAYCKKIGAVVEVCAVDDNNRATIYDPNLAAKNNGCGWRSVKLGQLIPIEYADVYGNYNSKTEFNKLKSMLVLDYARWTCTDGKQFESSLKNNHCGLYEAVEHQRYIESQMASVRL